MTAEQAGTRVNTRRQVWLKVEEGEVKGTVSLNTLRKYAAALNCRLVYAIVPQEESLEAILRKRAREVAAQIMVRTQHTMALEEQEVSDAERERQIAVMTEQLMRNLSPRIWENIHEL
jgi:predicted DNA-binding mobile mystery protein A